MRIKIYLLVALLFISFNVYAASIDRIEVVGSFVVNVFQDNDPVKEIDGIVIVPFDSEYQLLLKNNNDRKAIAKVTIDGTNISTHGDVVIPAMSSIKLERFITDSLDKGKRFKFVALDNPEVDDPTRAENGLIRVEFQLEEKREYIIYDSPPYYFGEDYRLFTVLNDGFNYAHTTNTSAEPGATIGGSNSDQKFHKVDIDLEDEVWVIELRMKGIIDNSDQFNNCTCKREY